MKEERILRAILETLSHSEVPAKTFLRYARIGVLLTEKLEGKIAEGIDDASSIQLQDEVAARGWSESKLATETEGEYLIGQFRSQLRGSVCDLYAFSDEIDIGDSGKSTPPLTSLSYPTDSDNLCQYSPNEPSNENASQKSLSESFPRSEGSEEHGIRLVVPRPGI